MNSTVATPYEHRQLERYADAAAALQGVLGGGWSALLDRFAKACEG